MTVDANVNALNYREQGGAIDHIGGRQLVEPGGSREMLAGGLDKLLGVNMPAQISFAVAAGGANVSEMTIVVKDAVGNPVTRMHNLLLWLSDAATGAGATATTTSGAVAAKAASGTDLVVLTAKKVYLAQTLVSGVYIMSITDTAKTGFYVCAQLGDLPLAVSAQLVAGNYG